MKWDNFQIKTLFPSRYEKKAGKRDRERGECPDFVFLIK